MRVLNSAQMREADRFTIEEIGIPSLVLMENAGRQVVAAMEAAFEKQLEGRVAVLSGRGNNGGDGFVVARTLLQRGIDTVVFVIAPVADVRIPYEVIDALEGPYIELLTPEQVRGAITPRAADSHKGDFGRVLVIAGSRGKTGAAHLAAMGALRSGAGLVTVATPESCLP